MYRLPPRVLRPTACAAALVLLPVPGQARVQGQAEPVSAAREAPRLRDQPQASDRLYADTGGISRERSFQRGHARASLSLEMKL